MAPEGYYIEPSMPIGEVERRMVGLALTMRLLHLINSSGADNRDIAEHLAELVGALGFRTGGNLPGVLLGVPGDYSDWIADLTARNEGDCRAATK